MSFKAGEWVYGKTTKGREIKGKVVVLRETKKGTWYGVQVEGEKKPVFTRAGLLVGAS